LLSDYPSRRAALLGLMALSGCGFQPLYGRDAVRWGAFEFDTGDSVIGFQMRRRLADRLGMPETPQFVIKVAQSVSQRAAAITADGDTARLNVIGSADWSLTDSQSGTQIETGSVSGFASYSATGSTVATQAAKDDATARLAVILADKIVTAILARPAEISG
jgi:LPS-assembly lipoprotein